MSVLLTLVVVLVGLGTTLHTVLTRNRNPEMTQVDKTKQMDNYIHLGALLLWPLLFFIICMSTNLSVRKQPYILFAMLWPVVLLLGRMFGITNCNKELIQEAHVRHSETRGSAGLLFTAAFGVGVLLAALRKDACSLGTKLVLLALLLCVAFLIPVSSEPVDTHKAHIIRTLQTCVTQMAIGLFILGITVSYFGIGKNVPKELASSPRPAKEA